MSTILEYALLLWGLGFVLLTSWLVLVQRNHNRITKNRLAAEAHRREFVQRARMELQRSA